jgi:pimeloyl-ACP methyl ester carboxylesterase
VLTINSSGTKPPFFWIKGKDVLAPMKRSLGADQPLVYLEDPEDTYENFSSYCDLERVAADYLKQIRRVQARGPYYFGGYCLGGLVACEIARQLRERGRVALLFLLDPPPLGGAPPLIGLPLGQHLDKLQRLGSRKKLTYVIKTMKDFFLKLTYKPLVKSGRAPHKTFRFMAYRSAIRDYRPSFCSDWTIIVKGRKSLQKNHFDWRNAVQGRLEIHSFDAFHEDLGKLPHAQGWIAYLQKYLKEAQAMPSKGNHDHLGLTSEG